MKLYVPLTPEALQEIVRRSKIARRRPQDEAALIIEHALTPARPDTGAEGRIEQ